MKRRIIPINPFRKEFLNYKGDLYWILVTYPVEKVKDHNRLKEGLNADLILSKDNKLLFLEKIEEVEYINI